MSLAESDILLNSCDKREKRDYEINENNQINEKIYGFRLFGYFRLFRNPSSLTFLQDNYLVGLHVFKSFGSSARPEDFHTIHHGGISDPEMKVHIVMRDIATAAAYFIHLLEASGE